MEMLNSVWSWVGLGGLGAAGILGVLMYASGAASVLRVGAAIVEAIVPLVKTVFELTGMFLKWILPIIGDIAWTALKDIGDSVKTAIFVLAIMFASVAGGWMYSNSNYNNLLKDHVELGQVLQECRKKLPKGTKLILPKKREGNGWFPGWPQGLNWPF